MKKISYIFFLIFIMVIIMPLLIIKSCSISGPPAKKEIGDVSSVKVYIASEDRVETMDLEDYVKGVVAAEMPATFEMEALKAQAVAARTYTVRKIMSSKEGTNGEKDGADICTDPTHCQAWRSREQARETWGFFGYLRNWSKISKAVDSTKGNVITYNGEIINPLFFSTSAGRTENSEEVFSTKVPYLRSVVSIGEESAPRFEAKVEFKFDDFKAKLKTLAPDIILEKKDINDIKALELSQAGYVKNIQIGNKQFTGREIRSLFSLNSADFSIKLDGDKVIFDTKGYGHDVGMSQYGANYLAGQGKTYIDILKHYYTGVEIVNVKEIKK